MPSMSLSVFGLFDKLPPELQDEIWLYILHDAQTAHFVTMECKRGRLPPLEDAETTMARKQPLALYRSLPTYIGPEVLLQTCRGSRAAALRFRAEWKPVSPLRMEASGAGDGQHIPSKIIDSSAELVILEHGWSAVTRKGKLQGQVAGFAAVRWSPSSLDWAGNAVSTVRSLLRALSLLKVLYVLISPDDFRGAFEPWPDELANWPREFLTTYETGEAGPGTFKCGDREYCEVEAGVLMRYGGLAAMVGVLNKLAKERKPLFSATSTSPIWQGHEPYRLPGPPAIRLLSWSE